PVSGGMVPLARGLYLGRLVHLTLAPVLGTIVAVSVSLLVWPPLALLGLLLPIGLMSAPIARRLPSLLLLPSLALLLAAAALVAIGRIVLGRRLTTTGASPTPARIRGGS